MRKTTGKTHQEPVQLPPEKQVWVELMGILRDLTGHEWRYAGPARAVRWLYLGSVRVTIHRESRGPALWPREPRDDALPALDDEPTYEVSAEGAHDAARAADSAGAIVIDVGRIPYVDREDYMMWRDGVAEALYARLAPLMRIAWCPARPSGVMFDEARRCALPNKYTSAPSHT